MGQRFARFSRAKITLAATIVARSVAAAKMNMTVDGLSRASMGLKPDPFKAAIDMPSLRTARLRPVGLFLEHMLRGWQAGGR